VGRICAILEEYGFRGTFLIDALASAQYGEKPWKRVCQELAARGHELGLHTHPHWVGKRYWMYEYDEESQHRLIERGASCMKEWSGGFPKVHRAGGFGANEHTLRALVRCGIEIDSSLFPHYPLCRLEELSGFPNLVHKRGEITEVPLSYFCTVPIRRWARYRLLDINACSRSELLLALSRFRELEVPSACILLHSFSFLLREGGDRRITHNRRAENRLRRLCDHIKREEGTNALTLSEVVADWRAGLSTVARFDESSKNRHVTLLSAALLAMVFLLCAVGYFVLF
jgi:peptidoglycan/xylan/chitin deacetylase (PgdA/CDA1 family)